MTIDKTDEKILAYLDNDARTPNTKIAKALRLNKNLVNYRIKNMEDSGLIKGYYTMIDSYLLGYQGYRFYLKFQYTDQKKEAEMMDYLVNQKNTWFVAYLRGRWDMAAILWVNEQQELVDSINSFISKYREFIEGHILVVYYGIRHYRFPFTKKYLKTKSNFDYFKIGEQVKIDNVDFKLLKFISANARASLVQIAKGLGITPGAVTYRMKQLKYKKIIRGFRPVFDTKKLGYSLYKIDINVRDGATTEQLYKFAREHDEIFYLDQTLGYADVEIEAQVNNEQQFLDLLDEIRTRFSGQIRNYSFFIVDETTKFKYIPDYQ